MAIGSSTVVGGYRFTFKGAQQIQGANYVAMRGDFLAQHVDGGRS